MTPCLIVITLKRIIPSSLVRVCIRDVCIMIRAIAFLPTVGECICASFPLAIVTYDTHITATVCLAWSTHNAALPKVHGTNQHENSAHSCSRPILYATIMASEIKMLIYRQKKHTSKTKTALCHRDHARVCGFQAASFVMPYIAHARGSARALRRRRNRVDR